MKQEIISYISTIEEDIYNLSNYLYTNPETSYNEFKACSYIIDTLKAHNFKVEENYCNIPTCFYAQYGNGHPKICYICKYTATENAGHIFGNNVNAAISIAAALGLSKVISKSGGSIILLGCPGEYSNGAEMTLTKENCFEDMDVIIAPHADIKNAESGTSMATIPIKIKYYENNTVNDNVINNYSSLDACLFTFNSLSQLVKGFCNECYIDSISIKGGTLPHNLAHESEAQFYLKAPKMSQVVELERKIKDFIKSISSIMNVRGEINLFELPCEELLTNKSLSRIFTHNLKECGIINITCCKNALYGLGIGSISHTTPCIYPSISIVNEASINCPSYEFAKATETDFCKDNMIKAAVALAITGLDIIEKQDLLKEITVELK